MIAVPGDTPAETISAIIADEAAIGMVNNKTTAVRLLPTPGKKVGDTVEMGGLLGSAPVMPVHKESSTEFVNRGGRIPAHAPQPEKLKTEVNMESSGGMRLHTAAAFVMCFFERQGSNNPQFILVCSNYFVQQKYAIDPST